MLNLHTNNTHCWVFKFYPLQIFKQVWTTCMLQVRVEHIHKSVGQHINKPCHIKDSISLQRPIKTSPSLSEDVIISAGTHESRSASIIPRGSSCATWCPRICRDFQEKDRYRRRKSGEGRTVAQRLVWTDEEVRLGQIESERRQKSRDRRTQSNVNTLNEHSCNHTEHHRQFSPDWWNPTDTGALSKFTQLMPSGSSLAIWWPLTCEQGNSTYKLTEESNHRLIVLLKAFKY